MDVRELLLARNTFLLGLGVVGVSVPWGAALAWLLFRTRLPARNLLLVLLAAPVVVPLYVQAAAWDAGFGKLGWYSLAWDRWASPPLRGWIAVIWIHVTASVPWALLIIATGLRRVERPLEEIALLDGTPWDVLRHVTLVRGGVAIVVAGVWVFLQTVAEITVTDLYQVRTWAEEIYTGFALGEPPAHLAAGLLPVLAIEVLAALAALAWVHRRVPVGGEASGQRPLTIRLGRLGTTVGLAAAVLSAGLLVGVPLINLFYNTGVVVELRAGALWRHWSVGKCWEMLLPTPGASQPCAAWRFRAELMWSAVLAVLAASMALAAAVPLAWSSRRGGRAFVALALVSAAGMVIPCPLVGVALSQGTTGLIAWSQGQGWIAGARGGEWLYDRTLALPLLALLIKLLPLALLSSWFVLRATSPALDDAARVDGAGYWLRLWHVGWRPCAKSLAAVWVLLVAVALGDASSASLLILPPGFWTTSLRVFDQMHAGVYDQVAALCLTSLAEFAVLAALVVPQWAGLSDRTSG